MIRDDVAYLFDLNDVPLYAFSDNILWETEDLGGSTNQLILTVPISEAGSIKTDQDVYFRGRKYGISEIEKSKNEKDVILSCDEIQERLSEVNNPTFVLKDDTLTSAATKALARAFGWSVGFVAEDARTYNAELLNTSAMFNLRFLESQSGTRVVFNSVLKTVDFVKDQEVIFDGVFRYGLNVSDITKTETKPQATVLYPFGKDGMTIENFAGGKKYIENYDWYVSLGMTLEQARAKYRKETVWTDERYIYVGNLYNDAKKKLAGMAQPQINYKLDNPDPGTNNIVEGSFVYVQDEELGIKIKTVVGRVKRSKNQENEEIELNYIPPSFGSLETEFTGDSSGRENVTSYFLVKNQLDVTLSATPAPVVSSSITAYSPTAFEMGIAAMIEVTTAGLLEGYFLLDGNKLPTEFKQTVAAGWHTVGLPFITTGIQPGTRSLYLYMKMTTGAAKISKERCEFYVKAQGVYGGASNDRPDQSVIDDVKLSTAILSVGDKTDSEKQIPKQQTISDNVTFKEMILASDGFKIEFK